MSVAGRSSMRGGVGAFTVLAMWLVAAPADATWSIVAVDPRTREVGSAGASCTPYVAGIVALAPDRGAIVAQAMSSAKARRRGARLLAEGASPRAIVTAISDPAFEDTYQEQQYGVAALGFVEEPAAFTGAQTAAEAGHLVGSGVSVQGNILTARTVLTATMDAFARSAGRPLAERLLLALEAGAAQGGDRRCGAQTAQSAYLVVARPSDPPQRPSIRYIVPDRATVDAIPSASCDPHSTRDAPSDAPLIAAPARAWRMTVVAPRLSCGPDPRTIGPPA